MKKLKIELNLITWISLLLVICYLIVFRQNLINGFSAALLDLTPFVRDI